LQISDSWGSVMYHVRKNFVIDLNHFELDTEYAVDVRTVFNPIFLVKNIGLLLLTVITLSDVFQFNITVLGTSVSPFNTRGKI
jgi:hypothetical protein